MFFIIYLSDMHLSDFLCASLDQCHIPGLRKRKKISSIIKRQNVANFLNFCGKIWDFKWQFSAMQGLSPGFKTLSATGFYFYRSLEAP